MVFFFFKQKTAYEMRISDWSSDVCSSDLLIGDFGGRNSRVCQLPLGMHELLLVHDGDGSEAQEFLAGLTEPRGIHLQNLPIIADLQIASDFPLDKAAKASDALERRARHFPIGRATWQGSVYRYGLLSGV